MNIHVDKQEQACRIELCGDLTIYTALETRDRLLTTIATCQGSDIELDLAGVTDMDTAGQQILIAARIAAVARRNVLRLVRHSPAVLGVMDMYGLGRFFGDPVVLQQPE